jgi:hypothetical protein
MSSKQFSGRLEPIAPDRKSGARHAGFWWRAVDSRHSESRTSHRNLISAAGLESGINNAFLTEDIINVHAQ